MRTGLRIRGQRGHPEVRAALIRYAKWLRKRYEFPMRVPVYLSPHERIRTIHGDDVSALFFAPFDRTIEPYIRIATGDYPKLIRDWGRDDCLASYIVSLSHEVVHYRQWIPTSRAQGGGAKPQKPPTAEENEKVWKAKADLVAEIRGSTVNA